MRSKPAQFIEGQTGSAREVTIAQCYAMPQPKAKRFSRVNTKKGSEEKTHHYRLFILLDFSFRKILLHHSY